MRDLLLAAATAVEDALKDSQRDEWSQEVGVGADGSPTALVDKLAEDAILRVVGEEGADVNLLSEEGPPRDEGSQWTLVMDPVDGTHNAISGIPMYSVSLAICRDDLMGAQWALVRNLANGWTYEAEKGKGARLNDREIKVSPYDPGKSLFSIYLGSNAHPKAFSLAGISRRVRNLGAASLDMCLVASGAADLYYVNSTAQTLELRITDIAASTLILREAGGEVYDLEGNVLNMPLNATYRSNLFALGDRALLKVVL